MMLSSGADRDWSNVRAVVFDAVGTLIHPVPDVASVYLSVAQKYGSALTREAIRFRFREVFRASESQDLSSEENLRTSEPQEVIRWRNIVNQVLDDVTEPEACFQDLFEHFGSATAWDCYRGAEEIVDHLQRAGFKLALASNFDRRLLTICNCLEPLRRIETRIVSSLCGWKKPARAFYQAVVDALHLPPDQILMVGDDRENDISGARRAGLHALRIDHHPDGTFIEDESLVITSLIQLRDLLS